MNENTKRNIDPVFFLTLFTPREYMCTCGLTKAMAYPENVVLVLVATPVLVGGGSRNTLQLPEGVSSYYLNMPDVIPTTAHKKPLCRWPQGGFLILLDPGAFSLFPGLNSDLLVVCPGVVVKPCTRFFSIYESRSTSMTGGGVYIGGFIDFEC